MRFSRSDVKVLLANYAIICAPGAMPPWFTDTVSLTRGFKKPSPASAGPGCRNTRCLGWFPDTPCKCSGWEEGWASHTDQERHHAPALSGLTANSVTASPRFFHSRSLEEPREGFPAALGKQHCFPPLQQTSAFKHENIINLLLSHNTHLPEQGDMKFRARSGPKRRCQLPPGKTQWSATLYQRPRRRAGCKEGRNRKQSLATHPIKCSNNDKIAIHTAIISWPQSCNHAAVVKKRT